MTLNTNTPASSALATNANDIHDIKPPVIIPTGWEWVLWALAALALGALLYALWKWWQKKRAYVPPVPEVPAHVRAKRKLREALNLIGQPKPFCVAVSDATRYYLEERFDFHAPERTTEEFLHELQRTQLLTPDQKTSLGEFLQRCDLVKFAKYEPTEAELLELHASAGRLIEETEPVAAPEGGEAAARPSHSAIK